MKNKMQIPKINRYELVSSGVRMAGSMQYWFSRILPFIFFLLPFDFIPLQSPIRLAVVDFVGDENREFSDLLRQSAKAPGTDFQTLDDDLVRTAISGIGYSGSLNLSREEAGALGQSIGCDFFMLGKILISRRVAANDQFYFEALAGLFFVETRTGRLVLFSFETAKAPTEQQARESLKGIIIRSWPSYSKNLIALHAAHVPSIESGPPPLLPAIEVLTDDLTAQGVKQPFFYQRIKPNYTEQADLAGIVATVELEAVFLEDGTVGDVEVVKWAGFGLDESAIATVKKLRFKPAEHDGKKLTLKGLVRYNFRRPLSQAEKQGEIERLKRSLRDIKKVPTQIPGQRPKL